MSAPLSTNGEVLDVEIARIRVLKDRRRIDPAWVKTLAEQFLTVGQMTPIEVLHDSDGYRLIFGNHRLAAGKEAGWQTVRAIVKTAEEFADEAEITLREITENLSRRELSVLDRAVDIARWREVYQATKLVRKAGRPRKDPAAEEITAMFAENFSAAAQKAFRLSERSVTYALKIASIPARLRDLLALHPIANNQSELLQLAAEPEDRQEAICGMLTQDPPVATSVAGAIAMLDDIPPEPKAPAWKKVSDGFSKLPARDQSAFFDLHEAAIMLWLKGRAA